MSDFSSKFDNLSLSFRGMPVVLNERLTIPGPEDWSRVRSPSRAERRRKRGFRQNIRQTVLPDPTVYIFQEPPGGFAMTRRPKTLVCHPATWESIKRAMTKDELDAIKAQ